MSGAPHFVSAQDLARWAEAGTSDYRTLAAGIGERTLDREALHQSLSLNDHVAFIVEQARRTDEPAAVRLDSIPFYSLCKGLFLPLSMMAADKVRYIFGLADAVPRDAQGREALLGEFLSKDIGLSLTQKLACILGDAFQGRRSTFRRDSMLRLLMGVSMLSRRQLLDELAVKGDIAHVFADAMPGLKKDPPLTAAEVLWTLYFLPNETRNQRFEILRSLLVRMGKLEAFFFAKLLLRKAGFGFDYQGPLIARTVAEAHGADPDLVGHAIALTDAFNVARILETEGVQGLKKIQLQPLVPVRPALCGNRTTKDIERYPVWVERKYDGIRIMAHKSTGGAGSVLVGAYTRRRSDWLELMPGFDMTLKMIPARSAIIDGEIYGSTVSGHGVRPATVYELYTTMTGDTPGRVNLRYAAFDLLYLDGQDLTDLPLSERRRRLGLLLAPLQGAYLPVPVGFADGQLAQSPDDVKRLYEHFRNQGYEGVIVKDLNRPYTLAQRDPTWYKRKPELTLDLVLIGAVFAVTQKTNVGMFGSYVIAARNRDGTFEDVGDVAGIDQLREADIQAEIMREGLLTGRRIERASASGARPGVELKPSIVVTVKFEGITKDNTTGRLSLRGPKLAYIRADKAPQEADLVSSLDELYVRQRMA